MHVPLVFSPGCPILQDRISELLCLDVLGLCSESRDFYCDLSLDNATDIRRLTDVGVAFELGHLSNEPVFYPRPLESTWDCRHFISVTVRCQH